MARVKAADAVQAAMVVVDVAVKEAAAAPSKVRRQGP
jgi:hypothetical protein